MTIMGDIYSWQQTTDGRLPGPPIINIEPWVEIHELLPPDPADYREPRFVGECFDPASFEVFSDAGTRWPRERIGERDEILWPLRLAVALRDNFTCRYCHKAAFPDIEMDHIVPWSAGGSDRSSNLRVLCIDCNRRRSNRRDGTEHLRPMPVTWWCVYCWEPGARWREIWRTGHDLNIGHQVETPVLTAFCANCRCPAMTDVTL